MNKPILVVGTGRSGTSTVARILHTKLDVCMGHNLLNDPTESEPKGSYEDLEMMKLVRSISGFPGRPSITNSVTNVIPTWKAQHENANCNKKLRGFKSTHLSGLKIKQWEELDPALVIITHRPKELVVASMKKWRSNNEDWEAFYDKRESRMKYTFSLFITIPVYHIYFDKGRKTDAEIYNQLKGWINYLERT